MNRSGPASPGLARVAKLTGAATFVLLTAGASVTSTGSGLAVPDWPLSYGKLFPRMTGGVLFEHGHRMVAGVVAVAMLVLAAWARRAEPRRWARRLAYLAFALVVFQAVLGGLTVLLLLPPAISVAHAGTAMLVFALVLSYAVVTSRSWTETAPGASAKAARLAPWAACAAGLIYAQILVGAVMRHLGAGLACPDFPLCHGRLLPPLTTLYVAIHFYHRVGGVLVTLAVWSLAFAASRAGGEAPQVARLAGAAAGLVGVQLVLGALSVTTRLSPPITVLHHAGGAALFGLSLALTLWCHRLAARSGAAVVVPGWAGEGAR